MDSFLQLSETHLLHQEDGEQNRTFLSRSWGGTWKSVNVAPAEYEPPCSCEPPWPAKSSLVKGEDRHPGRSTSAPHALGLPCSGGGGSPTLAGLLLPSNHGLAMLERRLKVDSGVGNGFGDLPPIPLFHLIPS